MDTPKSSGIVSTDGEQNVGAKQIRTHSYMDEKRLGYMFFDTLRFGEYHPFTVMETVPDDKKIRAQFGHTISSYTLKAPLMQEIKVNKTLCMVPREAILPINWNKWFKNPIIGDDVPTDAGTSVERFWTKIANLMNNRFSAIKTAPEQGSEKTWFHDLLVTMILGEMFYSSGNLMKSLGISGQQYFQGFDVSGNTSESFDLLFDTVIDKILTVFGDQPGADIFTIKLGNESYSITTTADPDKPYTRKTMTLREMICRLRDEPIFTVDSIDGQNVYNLYQLLSSNVLYMGAAGTGDDSEPLDLKRMWAYQLSVAHFGTNDKVDFVYSAELYRQYINTLEVNVYTSANATYVREDYFTINGMRYQYDYLSAHYFDKVIDYMTNNTQVGARPETENDALAYMAALFSYRRSLRYLDYFTGSRTQPLAVGDVNIQVNNNMVNVVDTVRKNFLARMLNAINIAGMRNYVEEIFGTKQAPDWHNPQYLLTLQDTVFGERVENTGAKQWEEPNSVTSTLNGNSERYAFEMDFDRSAIIIGIAWFDIDRVYSYATERQNLHLDRFDEFQPYMQWQGDQKLYRGELGTPTFAGGQTTAMDAFGYKLRNEEYKQRYSQCAGGFINNLPGYIFKADILETSAIQNQGSSFIRSVQTELDKFYLSLTGYSLGTYWHFICKWRNNYSGNRPMAIAPTIM